MKENYHKPRTMKKIMKRSNFSVTLDTKFEDVISNCGSISRPDQNGTWITSDMIHAYCKLHLLGYAHSVEVWKDEELVGGLYGISLGNIFFGESMFSKVSNASRYGFIIFSKLLEEKNFQLIDCQIHTPYLESLGAEYISRHEYLGKVKNLCSYPTIKGSWSNWF